MQSASTAQSLSEGIRYGPLSPFGGEGWEGEVGGAAHRSVGPLTLPSPPAGGGEGKGAAAASSCYFAAAIRKARISATAPESDLFLP
jgi:hypothetical protein